MLFIILKKKMKKIMSFVREFGKRKVCKCFAIFWCGIIIWIWYYFWKFWKKMI